MNQENRPHFPTFEGQPFDPEREKTDPKVVEALKAMPGAFASMVELQIMKDQGNLPRGARLAEIGQAAAKLSLRCLEGVPVKFQKEMVQQINKIYNAALSRNKYDNQSFISGYMGEFATGVLLNEGNLPVEYPLDLEDLRQSADLIAVMPNGERAHVQSKTISLPPEMRRGGQDHDRLPIFSSLRTPQELQTFVRSLSTVKTDNLQSTDRLTDVEQAAYKMHEQAQREGYIPIFCLLDKPGNPEMEASDIDLQTARPTDEAMGQALGELELIRREYS